MYRAFEPIRSRRRRHAFTLVELLVVVSIIAVLISILLPSLRSARESAKRTICASNLRSLGMGFFIYAEAYQGKIPAAHSLWDAPWGKGDMFWHQRLIEEGLAYGKDGPKKNNAVCPSDPEPWTPYTYTDDEELIYNTSYGANPVVLIVDSKNKSGQQEPDGVHDWNFWPYKGRKQARTDELKWPAYLVLITEVEGPVSPYFLDPWEPNKDVKTQDGEWAWYRHDKNFNGKSGGFVNMLHGDGSVTHSRVNTDIQGLSVEDDEDKPQGYRTILPEGWSESASHRSGL